MTEPGYQLLGPATLTIKCFTCKRIYTEREATVSMRPIYDEDGTTFIQYDVEFTDEVGGPVYIEDLLCMEKRCSVFGRTAKSGFAFPYLAKGRQVWHSHPDSTGAHFAMRNLTRV